MLPIILQHVRELAETHSAGAERDSFKIITPFPPIGPDFPDFDEDALAFGDPPASGDSASLDTKRAFDFFNRTDNLYYDFSYGIRSEDYLLSQICQRFFLNANIDTSDLDFRTSFTEKKDAFLNRYRRLTAGDLGNFEFKYTALSPVSWEADRVVINSSEAERLKAKAIQVYEDLEVENIGYIKSLIEGVRSSNYSEIKYDFGFFDVIREWIDPHLFESGEWKFSSGSRILYGETDPALANNDVKLCFAQRFYLVRNYVATASVSPPPPPPVVRGHGAVVGERPRRFDRRFEAAAAIPVRAPAAKPVDDQRRKFRNEVANVTLAKIGANLKAFELPTAVLMRVPTAAPTAVPAPRPGFVWIPDTAGVPGHWERKRAGAQPEPAPEAAVTKPTYKIAAVKCRVVPAKP